MSKSCRPKVRTNHRGYGIIVLDGITHVTSENLGKPGQILNVNRLIQSELRTFAAIAAFETRAP